MEAARRERARSVLRGGFRAGETPLSRRASSNLYTFILSAAIPRHEGAGMYDHVPNVVVNVGIALVIINAIFGVGLLIHELARPPRRFRAVTIGLLLITAIVIALQLATAYYFAFPNAEVSANLGVIFAYVSLMTLVISGRRWIVRLNRIVGGLGFVFAVARLAFRQFHCNLRLRSQDDGFSRAHFARFFVPDKH